mgnify:CR=1 FL=1
MRKLFRAVLLLADKVGHHIHNLWGHLLLWAHGVEVKGKTTFFGRPHFRINRDAHVAIGDGCTFRSSPTSNLIGVNRPCILSCHGKGQLVIGDQCGFSGTVIGCFDSITLGKGVRCGANTLITDSDWHEKDPRTSAARPVVIEDGVWLGVNVVVLKGVTIGKNSIIGAGSVVSRSIPANVIAAGNPCVVVKELNETVKK